jgi:hypothetical protein
LQFSSNEYKCSKTMTMPHGNRLHSDLSPRLVPNCVIRHQNASRDLSFYLQSVVPVQGCPREELGLQIVDLLQQLL